jgi:predicted TIM-barrel fold metal-dependent hydrolase
MESEEEDDVDSEELEVVGGASSLHDAILSEVERKAVLASNRKLVARVARGVARLVKGPTFSNVSMSQLSVRAAALVEYAFEGLEGQEIVDYHTHVLGTGACCDTGCFCPEADHVIKASFMSILEADSGVSDPTTADRDFVNQLRRLRYKTKHVLLAFDAHHGEDGTKILAKTGMYTPNEYVARLAAEHPHEFIPACSVHPYRRDALAELERAHATGARLIKWLPNAMGIDPSSERCQAFYDTCSRLGMVILSHAGEEKAVSSDPKFQEMGNPLLFRRALDSGVKVIIAHCASLGKLPDLDAAGAKKLLVPCFDLFLRMVRTPRWKHLLYGDISAITLVNRYRMFLPLLQATDVHDNLIHGSDYPLVCVSLMNKTMPFVRARLVTSEQGKLLREIYRVNPLMWDFVIKRIMRGPNGERFPDRVFLRDPRLGI